MFCSTVIPTIGRPTLSRAVRSILDQTFTASDFEVIVVNDSGSPLPDADWQRSERVRVINTNQRERSVARNSGAAIAKGRYLHFLDDDDWFLPQALESFWRLGHVAQAVWLYGGSQLVDRASKPIIQLHPKLEGNCFVQVMAGEWMPLQASLIESKTFFSVGGFNPLIPGIEDVDLARRVALRGELAGTTDVVACIEMGIEGSSTNYALGRQYGRWAREAILNESTAFGRMRGSASSSYWQGRIVRAYLTSIVWNLVHRKVFAALSRATYSLAGLILAGRHILSSEFWRAVTRSYESQTFLQGFREAGRPVERREYITQL